MKLKTTWDLTLLYKSDDDPRIEQDIKHIERSCHTFARTYKGSPFTATPTALAKALDAHEELGTSISGSKPWWYFALQSDLNSADSHSSALATKYGQRLTEATNKIAFFELAIAKISVTDQKKFLKHLALRQYVYALERIFDAAQYNLSEGEEQLVNLLAQTSYTMWIDAQEKLMNQQVIQHKGKNLPIVEAIQQLADLPMKERRKIHDKVVKSLKSISFLAEAELNATYNFKKVMDSRRGFAKPYSETILSYENDEQSIMAFVSLISKNFPISHRFYALHAKLLGEKTISLADRNSKIGEISTTFDFATSVKILRSVLGKIDQEYVVIFDRFLTNGQIDVRPRKGKKGGAYCWGMGQLPTFVLLNHVNDVRSLETLAHEMGHAIHTELSKQQPPRYQKYSTATAEVASTFFEQLIAEEIEQHLSDKEQIVMLHNRIMGDITTIFRQIACFNFELELHQTVRKEGEVSKEGMSALMSKHMRSYLGKAVTMTEDDGYYFVYWSHIRRFFYVYSYAYGQLVSRALYQQWKQDPAYSAKIKQFLSAGRSMSPEDIFKSIGIDTSKPSFFAAGLRSIEEDIARLEELTK